MLYLTNLFAPPFLGWGRRKKCSDIFSNIFRMFEYFLTFFNVNCVDWVTENSSVQTSTPFNFFYCIVFCIVFAFIKLHLYFILHFSYFTSSLKSYFFESKSILVLCKGRICTHRISWPRFVSSVTQELSPKGPLNTWYSITQEIR